MLPTDRDINAVAVDGAWRCIRPGPSGSYSIAGAMSFESLYLVNGVTVNENLRGQALQPLHRGRDSGDDGRDRRRVGRVRPVQRRRRQRHHQVGRQPASAARSATRSTTTTGARTVTGNDDASVRHRYARRRDAVRSQRSTGRAAVRVRVRRPDPRDRLWFFTAGRFQNQQVGRNTVAPVNIPLHVRRQEKRYEGKLTGSLNAEPPVRWRLHEGRSRRKSTTRSARRRRWTCAACTPARLPQDLFTVELQRHPVADVLRRRPVLAAPLQLHRQRLARSPISSRARCCIDSARGNLRYWSPTFCGVCDPKKRDNDDEFVKATYFKSTQRQRIAPRSSFGYDTFNDKRVRQQPPVGQRLPHPRHHDRSSADGATIYPAVAAGHRTIIQCNPIADGSQGTNFRTTCAVLQRQLARERPR